ncbi:c-type cytochrome [Candidatus Karelsulcia muelleri]|uniref:c-type cytochrome n=1 Tax=Candidatus Karelsulcia muelleri TaxID=336810 RepID=UPI0035C89726
MKKKKNFFYITIMFSCLIFFKNGNTQSNKDLENGKNLFKINCTACHALDLKKKLIGPPLYGINEKRNKEWLHKWIKNNKELINSGDKEAVEIYKKYNKSDMTLFTKLSTKNIDDILYFIKNYNKNIINKNNFKKKKYSFFNHFNDPFIKIIFLGIFLISLIIINFIYKLIYLLKIIKYPSIEEFISKKKDTFIEDSFYKKQIILFLIKKILKLKEIIIFIQIFFSFFVIWIIWVFLMKIDVNKGYKPNQPIFFSHKIHSGINKIHCQYCHYSSLYSKISGIPSLNVCMNCHISINSYNGDYLLKQKKFIDNEIKKIYKYLGWNEEKINFYENKSNIKWIRIHNLPKFVNFNHSQHIIVAGKEIKKSKNVDLICEACHGYVQNMDQVLMFNDFTMEWCIKCHVNTNINYYNNYYLNYYNKNYLNKKISSLGGIECGKCHY